MVELAEILWQLFATTNSHEEGEGWVDDIRSVQATTTADFLQKIPGSEVTHSEGFL
jgi:hypothetical protein